MELSNVRMAIVLVVPRRRKSWSCREVVVSDFEPRVRHHPGTIMKVHGAGGIENSEGADQRRRG